MLFPMLALLLSAAPCQSTETVTLALKEGMRLEAVAKWATDAFCEPFSLEANTDPKLALTVNLGGKVNRTHARRLLEAALAPIDFTLKVGSDGYVLARRTGPSNEVCERAARGIRVTGEFERTVSREAWNLEWRTCATMGARVVPSMKEGRAVGLKLFAIRPDSLFAAAGFFNGDLLTEVNGLPLTDPDEVLKAVEGLRTVEQLDFHVTRRDQDVHLRLIIEPKK